MGKRRTRKEKEKAKHNFAPYWGEPKKPLVEADVKRQFEKSAEIKKDVADKPDLANLWAKEVNLPQIKRDMTKSLILAAAMVALEIVLYLAWNVK